MVTRTQVVEEARTWLGVPWRHQGRTRRGVDCAGLIINVAHDLGLTDYDFRAYGRLPVADKLRRICEEQMEPVEVGNALLGDVVIMVIESEPQHMALLTDRGILHSDAEIGKVTEHRVDDRLWKSIVRAYHIPGVSDG